MTDKELREIFQQVKPPPVRPEVKNAAVRVARETWIQERQKRNTPRNWKKSASLFLAAPLAGAAAAALVALAAIFFLPGTPPLIPVGPDASPASITALEREREIFQNAEPLFDGRLKFIVIENEDIKMDVADGPVFLGQKVAVELQREDKVWHLIGYSGNRVELEINDTHLAFEILVTGDDEVVVAGPDFAWSSQSAVDTETLSIRARTLSG